MTKTNIVCEVSDILDSIREHLSEDRCADVIRCRLQLHESMVDLRWFLRTQIRPNLDGFCDAVRSEDSAREGFYRRVLLDIAAGAE